MIGRYFHNWQTCVKVKIDSMLKEVFELCPKCRRTHLQGKLKEIATTLNIRSPLKGIR